MVANENVERWEDLEFYKVLDKLPEKEYNDVAVIASQICQTPISLVTFLDSKRQFFKAHPGLAFSETPLDQSICLHAVKSKEDIFIVSDARKDSRFKENPLVTGDPGIVFYAGVPLFTPTGDPLGALCVIDTKPRSISESQKASLQALAEQVIKLLELKRKHLELEATKKTLQEEKNRLHNIIEATRVGSFEWNVETDEVKINRRWAEIVGYTLEELQPVNMDTWYRLLHPDDVAYSDAALKDCFDKKTEFYDIEIRMVHKAGHEVWINDRGRVVKWSEDGKPLLMAGTHTDITDRKNTELQLKILNDNIPGVVYRYKLNLDGSDELQLVSNGAHFLWGMAPEEAMKNNQLVWSRYHKEDLKNHKTSIEKSRQNLSFWTHEWRYHHPDGSERWHKGTGMPRRMEDGSTVWDAVILDVTEKKLAEIKLGDTLTSLQERIKEQHCLYQVTKLSAQVEDIDQLLSEAVALLPSGWKYPQHTSAKIDYDGKLYTTDDYGSSDSVLDFSLLTMQGKELAISINCHHPSITKKQSPFLKEEQQLLETVTRNLVLAIDHKEGSLQLKQSNRKIEGLIQTIDGIVWEADSETLEFNFVSQQVETILGYTPEEWCADPEFWQNHIHPEDKVQALSYCEVQTNAGLDHSFEYRMIAADGREVWINDLVTLVKENGKPSALRGLMVDITERKLVEKELELSEQRFKSLVQNGSDLIAILDFDANYQYVNSNSTNILGISPDEFIGQNAFNFIHPDDREKVFSEFSTIQRSRKITIQPYRFTHKDGSWRFLETVVTNMMDDPSIKGIVANSKDVTERVISERRLTLSEKRFKALVQEGADLTAILNLEGEYLYVSPNFPQIVGFSENELIGKKANTFFHPDDRARIELEYQDLANKKRIKSSPFRFKIKGGGWCWLQSVATNLLEDEAVRGVVINSVEITDLIATQERLKTSEARYRGFYESQTNFVIRTDLEGNYSYVNKKFMEDFGWIYPDGEILGKSCMPSICEHDQHRVIEVVEKCLENPEEVFKIEVDKPKRGGGTVTTLWDFICMVDGKGDPFEIQCMGVDISDRVVFERELKKSNERYEYVNRATKDAIYEWDVVADEFLWGEGFYRIFGYEKAEEIAKIEDWPGFMHPLDAEKHKEDWEQFLTNPTQNRWHKEYRIRLKTGGYLYTEEIGHMIRDESGNPKRMIGVLRDVSEIKNVSLHQELEHEISKFFKNEANLPETLYDVLEYLSRYGGYAGAEIWLTGIKGEQVNLVQRFWNDKTLHHLAGETGVFPFGEGLPGAVWKKGIPHVFEDLSEVDASYRKRLLSSGKMKSAVGIPLLKKKKYGAFCCCMQRTAAMIF